MSSLNSRVVLAGVTDTDCVRSFQSSVSVSNPRELCSIMVLKQEAPQQTASPSARGKPSTRGPNLCRGGRSLKELRRLRENRTPLWKMKGLSRERLYLSPQPGRRTTNKQMINSKPGSDHYVFILLSKS